MSKGKIVEVLEDAQYRVSIYYDTSYATARISELTKAILNLEQPTLDAATKILDLESERNSLASKLDVAILDAKNNNQPLNGEPIAKAAELVAEKNRAIGRATLEHLRLKTTLENYKKEKASLEKSVDAANPKNAFYMYCADYEDNLGVGDEINLIFVPGDNSGKPITIYPNKQPGNSGAAIYDRSLGQLTPEYSMSPLAFFLNKAIFPGWQRWLPTFRHGTITKINYIDNHCSVLIDRDKSREKNRNGIRFNVDLSESTDTELTEVPIQYMNCNALAFEVDDRVIVEFDSKIIHIWSYSAKRCDNWHRAKVIGFINRPRDCGSIYMETGLCSFPDFFPLDEECKKASKIYHGGKETELKENDGFIGKLEFDSESSNGLKFTVRNGNPYASYSVGGFLPGQESFICDYETKQISSISIIKRMVMSYCYNYSGITALMIQGIIGANKKSSGVGFNDILGLEYSTVIHGVDLGVDKGITYFSRNTEEKGFELRVFIVSISTNVSYSREITFSRKGLSVIAYLGSSFADDISDDDKNRLLCYAFSEIESIGINYYAGNHAKLKGGPLKYGWHFSNKTGDNAAIVTIETETDDEGVPQKRIGRLYESIITIDWDNEIKPLNVSVSLSETGSFLLPTSIMPVFISDPHTKNLFRVLKNGNNGFEAAKAPNPFGAGPLYCFYDKNDSLVVVRFSIDYKDTNTDDPESIEFEYPCGFGSTENIFVFNDAGSYNGGFICSHYDSTVSGSNGTIQRQNWIFKTELEQELPLNKSPYNNADRFRSIHGATIACSDYDNVPNGADGQSWIVRTAKWYMDREIIDETGYASNFLIIPAKDQNSVVIGKRESSVKKTNKMAVIPTGVGANAAECIVWARNGGNDQSGSGYLVKYLGDSGGGPSETEITEKEERQESLSVNIVGRSGNKNCFTINSGNLGVWSSILYPSLIENPQVKIEIDQSYNGNLVHEIAEDFPKKQATGGYPVSSGLLTFIGFIGNS